MGYPEDNYSRLDELIGKDWSEKRIKITIPGYTDVWLSQEGEGKYSLATFFDYKGVALHDPRVIFRVDHQKRRVDVVSQEDFFHHEGPEPRRRYQEITLDGTPNAATARALNRYLNDWLEFIERKRS